MKRSSLLLGATAAVSAAAVALLGGVLRAETTAATVATTAPSAAALADNPVSGFAQGDTAAIVRRLEDEVGAGSAPARTFTALGLAYQQRARETADPSYYSRSERALRRALALDAHDFTATSGLAALALARHDFRAGLELGRRAQRQAPGVAHGYGLVGDALVELGRYDEAFRAFDRMAALKPSLGSYARVSYGRELLGNTSGALEAMQLALGPARGLREPTAWVRVQIGKLHWGRGELVAARREFRRALEAFPGYVHALDGLAKAEAALGRHDRARSLARRAADSAPLPELVGTYGDLLATSGRRAAAREQYAVVGAIERVLASNGVRTDLETAVFDADHGLRLRAALARARAAHADRPSIVADDALSWALARNGRCVEAVGFSRRALRLGTRDALMFFHRGYAERCAGRAAEARRWFGRALELNPHFSLLWAPVARRALS